MKRKFCFWKLREELISDTSTQEKEEGIDVFKPTGVNPKTKKVSFQYRVYNITKLDDFWVTYKVGNIFVAAVQEAKPQTKPP